MKITKKLISLILASILLVQFIPSASVAAAGPDVGLQQLLRGFNVLSGEELTNLSTTNNLFKSSAGNALADYYAYTNAQRSEATTTSGKSIMEFAKKNNMDLAVTASADVGVGKLFKASAKSKFGMSNENAYSEAYETYFYQFLISHTEGKNEIKNFNAPATKKAIQNEVDPTFLNALKNARDIKRDIFDKFGTHFITSYAMGGWSEFNLSTINTNISTSQKDKENYGTEVSASGGYGSVTAGASATFDLTNATEEACKTGNFESQSRSITYGGAGGINFSSDATKITDTYNAWLNTFNVSGDKANCYILVDDNLQLTGIWELLPDGYEARKKQLIQEFTKLSIDQDKEFYNSFIYKAMVENNTYMDIPVNECDGAPGAQSWIEINSAAEFAHIGYAGYPLNGNYILMSDIDLAGIKDFGLLRKTFTGIFDGNGHTISAFSNPIQKSLEEVEYFGLFPQNTGTIKNLIVMGSDISQSTPNDSNNSTKPRYKSGIVTGFNQGTIENCRVEDSTISVTVHTKNQSSTGQTGQDVYCGGIAGENTGVIRRCSVVNKVRYRKIYANCYITGVGSTTEVSLAGGIVGALTKGSVIDCYTDEAVEANVLSLGNSNYAPLLVAAAGGIVGRISEGAEIKRCFSLNDTTATIYANSTDNATREIYAGEIAGTNWGAEMSDCFYLNGRQAIGNGASSGTIAVPYFKDDIIVSKLTSYGWIYNIADAYPILPEVSSDASEFSVYYKNGKPDFTEGDVLDNVSEYMTVYYAGIRDITDEVQVRYNFSEAGQQEIQFLYQDGTTVYTGKMTVPVKQLEFDYQQIILPVFNTGASASIAYTGAPIDLSTLSGLFAVDVNAGTRTYSIETGGMGKGTIGTDGKTLNVTKVGTFKIGMTTAATATHEAGAKVTAVLTLTETPNKVKVTGVKTLSTLYLVKGKTATLPTAIQPYNATNKAVTWASANKKIATVDAKTGKVKGVKTGKTTITVKAADGGRTAKCTVCVVSKKTALKSVGINPNKVTGLLVGRTLQVKPKLNPTKATGIVPIYKSGKPSIAVIDKAGVITALKAGKTTITVTVGKYKKSFVLTVGTKAASKITLNRKTASINKDKTLALKVKAFTPANTNPKTIAWKSSNTKIARVNSKGVVKGIKKGKATITATTWNGKTAKCNVTVK